MQKSATSTGLLRRKKLAVVRPIVFGLATKTLNVRNDNNNRSDERDPKRNAS